MNPAVLRALRAREFDVGDEHAATLAGLGVTVDTARAAYAPLVTDYTLKWLDVFPPGAWAGLLVPHRSAAQGFLAFARVAVLRRHGADPVLYPRRPHRTRVYLAPPIRAVVAARAPLLVVPDELSALRAAQDGRPVVALVAGTVGFCAAAAWLVRVAGLRRRAVTLRGPRSWCQSPGVARFAAALAALGVYVELHCEAAT